MGLLGLNHMPKSMNFIRSTIFLLVLTACIPICLSGDSKHEWNDHPAWVGSWKISAELSDLLGKNAASGDVKHPSTITIGFIENKESAQRLIPVEKFLISQHKFKKMNQEIVAVGLLETDKKFKGYQDRDSFCYVTQKKGITFLWIGSPDKSFMGAEVHYIRAKNPIDDVLILDFGLSNWSKTRKSPLIGNAAAFNRDDLKIPNP